MTHLDRLRHLNRERRAIDRGLLQEQVTDGEWILRTAELSRRSRRLGTRRRGPSFQWWR